MLHFINFDPARFIVDKIINGLTGRFHYHFKLGNLIDSQSQPWQRNKQIACPALEPRITGQNIRFVFLFIQKLVCSVDQTMLKSIARRTFFNLVFECFFQCTSSDFRNPTGKDDTFTFLYLDFKISGNIQILVKIIASLLLFRIFDTPIPVRLVMKLILFVQLHIQFGIARIHACFDTIRHNLIFATGLSILVCIFADTAKRQERT